MSGMYFWKCYSGNISLSPSGGYAGAALNLYVDHATAPTSYTWSAEFSGECNRWYIWPHNGRADVSVYLDSGDSGGLLRITCKVYSGSSLIYTAYCYVNIYGI